MRADAGTVVERIDFAQVEIGEFEVEYVDVLSDSSIVYGFRDDDQAVLKVPTDQDLRGSLAVAVTDSSDDRVGEQGVGLGRLTPPTCVTGTAEWAPRFDLDPCSAALSRMACCVRCGCSST